MKQIIFLTGLVFFTGFVMSEVDAQTIDESLEMMTFVAWNEMEVASPTEHDPVKLNGKVVWSENKEQMAVVLKVNLLTNWHIYSEVTQKSPFIPTTITLELPDKGLTALGEWEKPPQKRYNEEVNVYQGEELSFVRYYVVDKNTKPEGEWKCKFYYQACDPFKCFPPKTKKIDLIL